MSAISPLEKSPINAPSSMAPSMPSIRGTHFWLASYTQTCAPAISPQLDLAPHAGSPSPQALHTCPVTASCTALFNSSAIKRLIVVSSTVAASDTRLEHLKLLDSRPRAE